jgi:DNA-binding response OmpR family regulator
VEAARVLLVDDEASIRTGLSIALSRRGYEVETCAEGLPALVEIRTAHHGGRPYQSVVLDVHLPDIDGLQLLRSIKASYPDTPVLVISGYGNEVVNRTVDETPGSRFLGKPFAPNELIEALERLAPQEEPVLPPAPERRGPPAMHATAFALLRLAKEADAKRVMERLGELDGLCYCEPVLGRWDLVALLQDLDRSHLERRLSGQLEGVEGVSSVELLHTRQPLVEPDMWSVLVDSAGASAAAAPQPVPETSAGPKGPDAFVILEVDPAHLVEVFVRAQLMEQVVQCDATRDRAGLVLVVQDWTGDGELLRVPDSLRLLPGVLRARALPITSLEAKLMPPGQRSELSPQRRWDA